MINYPLFQVPLQQRPVILTCLSYALGYPHFAHSDLPRRLLLALTASSCSNTARRQSYGCAQNEANQGQT